MEQYHRRIGGRAYTQIYISKETNKLLKALAGLDGIKVHELLDIIIKNYVKGDGRVKEESK